MTQAGPQPFLATTPVTRHNGRMTSTPETPEILVSTGEEGRDGILELLTDAGVGLNDSARVLLAGPEFEDSERQDLIILFRTTADLGLPHGGTLPQVLAAAVGAGFELCPLTAAPYLRLALLDQADASDSVLSAGRAPSGAINVASHPPSHDVEHPKGFYLRVVDGQRWLRGYRCDDEYEFPPEQVWALALPGTV